MNWMKINTGGKKMKQEEYDFLNIEEDSAVDEIKACNSVLTVGHKKIIPSMVTTIKDVLEKLPEDLKKNFAGQIEKKLEEIGLNGKFTVKSEITIGYMDVQKTESGTELYNCYFQKLYDLTSYNPRTLKIKDYVNNDYHCILKLLVDKQEVAIRKLLNKWADKTSLLKLDEEEYLIIKNLLEKMQEFQQYTRLCSVNIETCVEIKGLGDMLWKIQISLPEMNIENTLSVDVESWEKPESWEVLAKSMNGREERYSSFSKALLRLMGCEEWIKKDKKEKARIEESACQGLAALFA